MIMTTGAGFIFQLNSWCLWPDLQEDPLGPLALPHPALLLLAEDIWSDVVIAVGIESDFG